MPSENGLGSDLATVLIARTDANKLQWKETADPESFRVLTRSGTVEIQRHSDTHFSLMVFDPQNREVDLIRPTEDNSLNKVLSALWAKARRIALQTDDTLKKIIHELSST